MLWLGGTGKLLLIKEWAVSPSNTNIFGPKQLRISSPKLPADWQDILQPQQ